MKTNIKQLSCFAIVSLAVLMTLCVKAASPTVSLSQGSNGTDPVPIKPVKWINGNLNSSAAHFLEGMSVPYQAVMANLPLNTKISLIIGYDVMNSSKHAFDYLTHYNRLIPHTFTYHTIPEPINELAGSGIASAPFTTYLIPAPSSSGSTVAGQPTTSFNKLTSSDRLMTLFNGTIDSIYYKVQGSLTASQSETQIVVVFHVSNSKAVLGWGAHIASRADWGYSGGVPLSSGGISGSPFHMRLNSWNLGSLGSQDRSIAGTTVILPPSPLPVELLYFNAERINCSTGSPLQDVNTLSLCAQLSWATATEVNSNYFFVEKSIDGLQFATVGSINAAGNSTSVSSYSFTDNKLFNSVNYYRLRETDNDGACQYSSTVAITSHGRGLPGNYSVIYNLQGSMVKIINSDANGDISDLPFGIYILQYQKAGELISKKIFIPEYFKGTLEDFFTDK